MKSRNILFLKCHHPPWIHQCVWSEIADSCAEGYYWAAADPGFPRGRGHQPQRVVCQPIIWKLFLLKMHENEINWTEGCNPRGFATAEYRTHDTWIWMSLVFPELPLLAVHMDLRGQPATTTSGRSKGGCKGHVPPLGGPNSFNFMQFSGKYGKIVCWCPPGELAPPPRGNPGSATVNGNEYLVLEMDRDKINGQLILPKGLPDKFTLLGVRQII